MGTVVYNNCTQCCSVPVPNDCCPTDPTAATLYATLYGGTGDCTCLDGVNITLSNNSGGTVVTWDSGPVSISCGSTTITSLQLTCSVTSWLVSLVTNCTGANFTSTFTCDPFSLTITLSVSACCTGDITITITQ